MQFFPATRLLGLVTVIASAAFACIFANPSGKQLYNRHSLFRHILSLLIRRESAISLFFPGQRYSKYKLGSAFSTYLGLPCLFVPFPHLRGSCRPLRSQAMLALDNISSLRPETLFYLEITFWSVVVLLQLLERSRTTYIT